MAHNDLVSIVLPTHNGEKFLRFSIESILCQSYNNWELIIVDDASTDDTSEIIKSYSKLDSRIKTITNSVNRKLPESLNIGHKESSGEYITWTSDDNIYHKDAIGKMVEVLEGNHEIGMVFCDESHINENGEIIGRLSVGPIEKIVRTNCIGACFLYRRSVYTIIGDYSTKVLYAEDYDYWIRVACKFKMVPLHEELYYYRIHKDSLSSTINLEIRRKVDDWIITKNLTKLTWLPKNDRYDVARRLISRAFVRRDFPNYWRSIGLAFFLNPKQLMVDGTLYWRKRIIHG